MARRIERQEAIRLRKQGKTYSEIRRILKIPKSTLSDWLSKFPLTGNQILLLEKSKKKNKELAIEKTRLVKQRKRELRLASIYESEKQKWTNLTIREINLAGFFLYWGEGNKRLNGPIFVNNTDPSVLKFVLYWFKFGLEIPKEKIRVYLHLYSDMSVEEEMLYWSRGLKLPLSQFTKPYIKKSKKADIDQKGFGHGTCGVGVNNVQLKEKIMMTIKAIADYYSSKI